MPQNRGLKNRHPLYTAINNTLYVGLELLHRKSRIDKSKLLDEAIEDLLKKHNLVIDLHNPAVQEIIQEKKVKIISGPNK
jgi:hypothetical protein